MFPRKITSLSEDMQKLGLTHLVNQDINGSARKPVTESKDKPAPKAAKALSESKKQRAAKIRENRMAKHLAMFETRLQRIERAAKKSGQKVEFKIRMVKGLQKRAAVMESYDVRKALGSDQPTEEQLALSFLKVAGLSGALARNFSVLEHYFSEAESSLGIPVMHAASAYGYETNVSNAANSDASGEVTDYAGAKAEGDEEEPKDDMAEADDDEKDPLDAVKEDDEKDDDDDKLKEDDDLGDDDEVKEDDEEHKDEAPKAEGEEGDDDDDDDKKKKEPKEESRKPVDFELHAIRLEAEEQAANVNMGYASDLMNDMVSYLGGAMKLYFKLQQSMKSMGYVGQDQPVAAGGEPTPVAANPAVIGQAQPEGATAIDQGGVPNAPKTGDAIDTAGVEAPKA